MKLRKSILALALVCGGCFGAAAEDNYLHIQTATGWQVLNIENVDRLTFTGGNMTATDASNNVVLTVPQSSLQTMVVNESAGLTSPVVADAAATFTFDAASATATMLADGAFEVYGISGALLVKIPAALKGQTVCLDGMNPGVVILKSGDYALKAAIR